MFWNSGVCCITDVYTRTSDEEMPCCGACKRVLFACGLIANNMFEFE